MQRKIYCKEKRKRKTYSSDNSVKKLWKHSSIHHYIPTSRNGPDEDWNKKENSIKFHEYWHNLFSNLKPREIITLIKNHWTNPDRTLKIEELGPKQLKLWKFLFGERNPEQAITIIKNRWSPREEDYENWMNTIKSTLKLK